MLSREEIRTIEEIREYVRKYNYGIIQTDSYYLSHLEFTLNCIENMDKEIKDIYNILGNILEGDHK